MMTDALALTRGVAAEVKLPMVTVTFPVGDVEPLLVETVTFTVKLCAVVMLVERGDTATVGVNLPGVVTDTVVFPVALL
jgi:hypothetical protein